MAAIIWESFDSPDIINEFGKYCVMELTPIHITRACHPICRIIAKGNKYQGVGV